MTGAAKILCVEPDSRLLESRCDVLRISGYDVEPASPPIAEVRLRDHKFDLLVVSSSVEPDLHSVANLLDGAAVLVLERLTMPSELLSLVSQRLQRGTQA